MHIHFGNPLALVLLACLVPVVLWARKSMAGLGRVRGLLALILRIAIVALIVLALARTQWARIQDDLSVMYVVDQSLSIPSNARRDAIEFVKKSQNNSKEKRRDADTVGLVMFGRQAALERRPGSEALLNDPDQRLQSVILPDRTNIAAALRLALAAFPSSSRKRIVLVSDGNENIGSLAEETDVAARNGVRIDVLPIRYTYSNEVMIEKVIAPADVEKKASFEVRTVVNAYQPQRAILRLTENGGLIGSETVQLKEGRNVFVVQRTLPEPGYYSYVATVEGEEDTLYANNRGSAFTMVRGRGRVLLIDGNLDHAQPLFCALKNQGLDVQLEGLEALPMSLGEIIPHDVLILSNVPAGSLGQAGMRTVELAVKDWGVGLIMIGGSDSFGAGGYQDSPVEKALPVSMDVKNRKVMPSGALVVILHTCEIAQGNYWAQQIALAALRVLSPTDEYGIVYYDWQGGVKWLFDLQRITDKSKMAALINTVTPGDMPDFIPAFQAAHKSLKASNASVKHVVVISDGDPAYPSDQAVLNMVADGITISAVGISPHSANDTKRMAYISQVIGGGRYYEPQSPSALPQIFIKEAATVRRALIFEDPFEPRQQLLSELVRGIGAGEYPMLHGYVLTSAKPLAEVPLVSNNDDPILAHWQYGLGRAVAFTSDAKSRWAAEWLGWGKYEQFWAQVVRWCARNVQDAGLRVRVATRDDRVHVIVDALDKQSRFLNNLEFVGNLITPDHREVPVDLEQTGPGRYEAFVDADDPGTHFMSLRYTDSEGKPALYTHGMTVPYSAEFKELNANDEKLKSIAKATHGHVIDPDSDVFARTFDPEPRYADTWPLLMLVAICLVPFDIFVRRVFVDYGAAWRRALAFVGGPFRRVQGRPSHVTSLLSRKRATREQIQRRTRKFAAHEEDRVALDEATLMPSADKAKPKIAPIDRPKATSAEPAIASDDESYTGRLLRAKRKAREETEKPSDAGPSGEGREK